MRVQRAPRAADQPQPRDAEPRSRPREESVAEVPAGSSGGLFSAEVSVDLTGLGRDAGDQETLAEVVVLLLAACREERLVDDLTTLQVLTPVAGGWAVARIAEAVRQSAYGITAGLATAAAGTPGADAHTLTLVRMPGDGARAGGDWGLSGLGVATLGTVVSSLVPSRDPATGSMVVAIRRIASLGLAVPASAERAGAVVRALDRTAREVRASRAGSLA